MSSYVPRPASAPSQPSAQTNPFEFAREHTIRDDWALRLDPETDTPDRLRAGAFAIMSEGFGIKDPTGRVFSGAQQNALDPKEYFAKAKACWDAGSLAPVQSEGWNAYHEAAEKGDRATMRRLARENIRGEDAGNDVAAAWDPAMSRIGLKDDWDMERELLSVRDVLTPEEIAIIEESGRARAEKTAQTEFASDTFDEDFYENASAFDFMFARNKDLRDEETKARHVEANSRLAEVYRRHADDIRDEQRLPAYEKQLADENLWATVQGLRGAVSDDAWRVVEMAQTLAGPKTDKRVLDAFEKLTTTEQRSIAGVLHALHYGRDTTLVGDAFRSFWDTAAQTVGGSARAIADVFRRGVMDGKEYRDMVERRALLEQANSGRMKEWGYLGQSVVGAFSTIPYMAVAAIPYAGTAAIMASASDQFQTEAALNGVDVGTREFMLTNWAFSGAYAAVEKLQIVPFKPLKNVSRRQMYCEMFHSLRSALFVAGGVAGTTVSESVEEGIQGGIERVVEGWGLGHDQAKEFAAGFASDFVGSLGTMAIIGAGGAGVQHHRYRSGAFSPEEAISATARVADLESRIKGHPEDAAVPLGEFSREYGMLGRDWVNAGTDGTARVRALLRWGFTPEQATRLHGMFSEIWRGVSGDEEARSEFVGGNRVRSAAELLADTLGVQVEDGENGEKSVSFRIGRGRVKLRFNPADRIETAVDVNDRTQAADVVEILNRNEEATTGTRGTMTVDEWLALPEEVRREQTKGMTVQGGFKIDAPDGTSVGEDALRVLSGRVIETDVALPQTVFHESMHAVLRLLREEAAADPEAKALQEELAKVYAPQEGIDEAVNEEALADGYQTYLTSLTTAVEDTGVFARLKRWIAQLLGRATVARDSLRAAQSAQGRLFNLALTGDITPAMRKEEAKQEEPRPSPTPAPAPSAPRYSVTPHGVQKQAGVAYPDASSEIVRFSIGARRREEYRSLLANRRPDLDAEKVLAELDKLGDPKKEKVALHWVIRGGLALPQDAYKIDDALDVAAKAKVDPFAYKSPDELLLANKQFKPTARPIDPATVPELSDPRDEGDGIVSYEVQDDQQGQAAMRRIIDTHWGEDANPWCLLARDKHTEDWTNLYRSWFGMAYPNELQTADNFKKFADEFERRTGSKARSVLSDEERMQDAWYYWNHYNALPKRVAFKDGKLLAFMATDVYDSSRDMFGDEILNRFSPEEADRLRREYEEWHASDEGQEEGADFYEWLDHEHPDVIDQANEAEQWWDRKDESHPDLDWARDDSRHQITATPSAADLAEARRQYDEVVARYTNPDGTKKPGWLKAPNGADTHLTERQWVQVRTPAFKAWFGDWENDPANASKVVDENGEPRVVWHGSNWDPLAEEPGNAVFKHGKVHNTSEGEGFYFTPDKSLAEGWGDADGYFLNIRGPSYAYDKLGLLSENEFYDIAEREDLSPDEIETAISEAKTKRAKEKMREVLGVLREKGYSFYDEVERDYIGTIEDPSTVEGLLDSASVLSGFVDGHFDAEQFQTDLRNAEAEVFGIDGYFSPGYGNNSGAYVAFTPSQVKSATDNVGTFSGERGDVRYSISGIYTGTAADYDKPSLHYVGTGEGSQVYGWGLYGSNVRGVAEGYAAQSETNPEILDQQNRSAFDPTGDAVADEARKYLATMYLAGANSVDKAVDAAVSRLRDAKKQAQADWLKEHSSEFHVGRRRNANVYEQTFFTDREPGDESHLLKWYEPVTKEQREWIKSAFEKEKAAGNHIWGVSEVLGTRRKLTGGEIYKYIAEHNGSEGPRIASEFLARAGIDGVKYPVDSFGRKGVKDGDKVGWNYVSFRDDNIRVDHKWTDGVQRYQISGAVGAEELGILGQRVAEAERAAGDAARASVVWNGPAYSYKSFATAYAARDRILGIDRPDDDYRRLLETMGVRDYSVDDLKADAEKIRARGLGRNEATLQRLAGLAEQESMARTVESLMRGSLELGEDVGSSARRAYETYLARMRRTAKGRDYTDLTADLGFDLADLALAIDPETFAPQPKPEGDAAPPAGGSDAETGAAADEGPEVAALLDGKAADFGLTEEQLRERIRERMEQRTQEIRERLERIRARLDEWRAKEALRKAKLAERQEAEGKSDAPADVPDAEMFDAEQNETEAGAKRLADYESECVEEMPDFRAFLEECRRDGLDLSDAAEFVAAVRIWSEDFIARETGADPENVLRDPVNLARYRATMMEFLHGMADAMLDPEDGAAAKTAERMMQEIPSDATVGEIDGRARTIVGFIQRNGIRQTRKQLIRELRKGIKLEAIRGKKWDEMERDAGRKVTGEREAAARYLYRILTWSDGMIAKESARLHDIVAGREDAYRSAGADDAALKDLARTDREVHRAAEKLQALQMYGGLRKKSPAEIKVAARAIMSWLTEEREAHEKRWNDWHARLDALAQRAAKAASASAQDYTPEDPGYVGKLADELTATIRQRLEQLFVGGGADARAVIDEVMRLVYTGSERMRAETAAARRRTDEMLERCVQGTSRNVRQFLKDLDAPIPEDLNRQLRTAEQPVRMTNGQALQLLASLEQVASYAGNIEANGRGAERVVGTDPDGNPVTEPQTPHAELLRRYFADKPAMVRLLEGIREVYEERRGALSDTFRAVTGNPILAPDPLYAPVKMFRGSSEGFETQVRAWDPFGPALQPRVKNTLDFDLSASIMDVYNNRTRETCRAIAWGIPGMELRSVLCRKEVQDAIARTHGKFPLRQLVAHLTDLVSDGWADEPSGFKWLAQKLGGATTYSALSWNVVTALKQTASIPAWTALMDGGYAEVFRNIANFDRAAARELMDAPGFAARYGSTSFGRMFKDAIRDPNANPLQRFFQAGMTAVQMGDFVPGILVGTGVYKAKKLALMRQGLEERHAREEAARIAWGLIEECQQSSRLENSPAFLRRGGFLARQAAKFASSPLLQVSHEVHTLRMWAAEAKAEARRNGGGVRMMSDSEDVARWRRRFVNQLICNHVLMPVAFYGIATMFNIALGSEPPDEEEVLGDLAMQTIVGPFGRIFLLGMIFDKGGEAVARAMGGKPNVYDSTGLAAQQYIQKIVGQLGRIGGDVADADWESVRDDLLKMLGQVSAPARYAVKIGQNAAGYDPAEARRERKAEIRRERGE